MSNKNGINKYMDIIDKQQSDALLHNLVNKVLENSKPKSKYVDHFQSPKLPLSPKKSVYEDSYKYSPNYNSLPKQFQPQKRKLATIISDSSYRSQFYTKNTSKQLMSSGKKRDNIKLGGPMSKDSSYSQQFQDFKQRPPKVDLCINPQNLSPVGAKLRGSSCYHDSYKGNRGIHQGLIKRQGYLKVNGQFVGGSTYKEEFKNMGPSKAESFLPKREYQPSLGSIVTSSYQIDFKDNKIDAEKINKK